MRKTAKHKHAFKKAQSCTPLFGCASKEAPLYSLNAKHGHAFENRARSSYKIMFDVFYFIFPVQDKMPRQKTLTSRSTSKLARGESSTPLGPKFDVPAHQVWYNHLTTQHIGKSREINRENLHEVGLTEEVQHLLSIGHGIISSQSLTLLIER